MPDFEVFPDDDIESFPDELNPLELTIRAENQRKQAVATALAIKQKQDQEAAANPENWSFQQTKDHFKQNPPKNVQEDAAAQALLNQKKKQIKIAEEQISGAQLKAAPPKNVFGKMRGQFDKILGDIGIIESPEARRAKAEVAMIIAKRNNLDPVEVEKNYEDYFFNPAMTGMKSEVTPLDMVNAAMTPAVVAGIVMHPEVTVPALAAFGVLDKIVPTHELLKNTNLTREARQAIELLDMVAKGGIAGVGGKKVSVELYKKFPRFKEISDRYHLMLGSEPLSIKIAAEDAKLKEKETAKAAKADLQKKVVTDDAGEPITVGGGKPIDLKKDQLIFTLKDNGIDRVKPEELAKYPDLQKIADDAKVMHEAAAKVQPEINKDVLDIQKELGLTQPQHANQKKVASIISKSLRKNRPPSDLSDLARGAVVLDNIQGQFLPAADSLRSKGYTPIADYGDVMWGGYRPFHYMKTFENGVKGEVQLHTPETWKLKTEISDAIYRTERPKLNDYLLGKLDPKEAARITKIEKDLTQQWDEVYGGGNWPASKAALSSGRAYRASEKSPETIPSVTGIQEPSLNTLAGEPSPQGAISTKLPSGNLNIERSIDKNITPEALTVKDGVGKERQFIQTVREAPATAPEVAMTVEGKYLPISNEQTLAEARNMWREAPEEAERIVAEKGALSRIATALGVDKLQRLNQEGKISEAVTLSEHLAERATESGQAVQALYIYQNLTPEGVLIFAQRMVKRAREGIKQKERLINFDRLAKGMNEAERTKLADKLDVPHISEILAKELQRMAQEIQTMPEGRQKQIQTALMLKKIADVIPKDFGKKLSMIQTIAQLLNPKTFVRNLLGNIGFQLTENVADTIGAILDIGASLRTGKRTVYVPDLKTQGKGLIQGFKEGTEEALLGVNIKDNQSKFTLPKHGVFDKGVMGALEKTLRVSLGATDRAFYQAAFNQSIREQTVAAKLAEPTAEMIEKAHAIGLYRTFQDDNVLSNQFVALKKWLNAGKSFGIGDIVLKYPKTPGNILARGIEYSPFGFMKTVYELAKPLTGQEFNQEAFVRSTSRATVGSALLVGTGAILAQLGIISGRRDKDRDVEATRENAGIRSYQINASALKRFVMSGMDPEQAKMKEGDDLVSYDWMQPASIGLALGANMVLDPNSNIVDRTINLGDRLLEASETLQEQPLVRGVKTLTQRGNIAEGLSDTFKDIPASFVPTVLNQVRQLVDNTARNTKDPNYAKEVYNKMIMRVPVLSGQLPPKITTLGEEKEIYQMGRNNPFNVFLNPAFVTKYEPDPVSKMVLDIWETTGSKVHFPRVAQAKIKLGSETKEPVELSPGQYTAFQKYIGHRTDMLFTILSRNRKFMSMPPDVQAKKLQGYLTDIHTAAKIQVLGYRPDRVDRGTMDIIRHMGRIKRDIDKEDSLTTEEEIEAVPDTE